MLFMLFMEFQNDSRAACTCEQKMGGAQKLSVHVEA